MTTDTMRQTFESWAQDYYHGTQSVIAKYAWQAATAVERERCAKVCEELEDALSQHRDTLGADIARHLANEIRSGE